MKPNEDQVPTETGDSARRADRLWQHTLHLDTMLFQRSNLFLVAESLLVVAYTSILGAASTQGNIAPSVGLLSAARVIASFGLLSTVVWAYVGARHLLYYKHIADRMKIHIPEYREAREGWTTRGPSSLPLVTYGLPAFSFVMWSLLLIVTWL